MKKQLLALIVLAACTICSNAQPQLWGTMSIGGTFGIGGIIKINGNGTGFTKVYSCMGGTAGGSPQCALLPEGNNLLYGNTLSGGSNSLGDVFSYNTASNTYTTLYSMDSATGYYPRGNMMKATNNKLYGLTSNGGAFDKGVFFSLDPSNSMYVMLHEFDVVTGQFPNGSIMQASLNNKLYGMTTTGGATSSGVIFSYDITGNVFTVVHDFDFITGFSPFGSLMEAANGLLYGMAFGGGTTGHGVIFSFDPANNNYAVVHNFNSLNGAAPYGTLIETSGILYGNTSQGGTNNKGIIFSFNLSNNTFTKLHDFSDATGASPFGNVMRASDGRLYGMTNKGGANNLGAIFSFDLSNNTYTKIYDGSFADGGFPYADLIEYTAPTGISETEMQEGAVLISPNPSDGMITVSIDDEKQNATFTITNCLNQKIKEYKLTGASTQLHLNLPGGIYFYMLINDRERHSGKIVIK